MPPRKSPERDRERLPAPTRETTACKEITQPDVDSVLVVWITLIVEVLVGQILKEQHERPTDRQGANEEGVK